MVARMLVVLLVFLSATVAGRGQSWDPTDLPSPFFEGTLEEALKESKDRHRPLIVYIDSDDCWTCEQTRERVWTHPTIFAWVRWHAVLYHLRAEDNRRLARQLGGACDAPTIVSFKQGKRFDTHRIPQPPAGFGGPFSPALGIPVKGNRPVDLRKIESYVPPGGGTPLEFLMQMDFVLERMKAADPLYGALHDRRNPPPSPPPRSDPMHQVRDANAPAVTSVDIPDRDDPFSYLDVARSLVEARDWYQATAVYTWLWEELDRIDPALAPLRRSVVVGEMATVAFKRDGARERFRTLHAHLTERLLWADFAEQKDWVILGCAIGDAESVLDYAYTYVYSNDSASMLPAADRIASDVMLSRDQFADPWEIPSDGVDRIERLARMVRGAPPRGVHPDDWPGLLAFARDHLLDEGCRLAVAYRRSGDSERASAVVGAMRSALDGPLMYRALVATHVGARVDAPELREWLSQSGDVPLVKRLADRVRQLGR